VVRDCGWVVICGAATPEPLLLDEDDDELELEEEDELPEDELDDEPLLELPASVVTVRAEVFALVLLAASYAFTEYA
jgi:hypothetical protein